MAEMAKGFSLYMLKAVMDGALPHR